MAKNNVFIFYLLFNKLFSINSSRILDTHFCNIKLFFSRWNIIIYITEMQNTDMGSKSFLQAK